MSLCGAQCHQCSQQNICQGCKATSGQPFGKPCFIARYIQLGGKEALDAFKAQLVEEINQLAIPGLAQVTDLVALNGRTVNLPYPLPSGQKVAFLDDDQVYLGAQLPCEFDESRMFGVVAGMDFILVCRCDDQWMKPELVVYRKR
ncbi:MAG: DUF3795 domain-containing protein [Clostridia bacterium]|nr:DUF3795 domain-containing protein [Clostridia bacterium]